MAPIRDNRLAAAVAALSQRGEDLSVRVLRREAGCSTDAAREYLATMRVDDAPEQIPDLSAPVAALYGVAYSQAAAVLRAEYAQDLETARRAEATAVDAEDQAQATAQEAQRARAASENQAGALRQQITELNSRLEAAEARAADAERAAAEADRRAVDAAATARTLRDVLDSLRPPAAPVEGSG